MELTTSNDIISGDDDEYTAELGFRFALSRRLSLDLGERIFTDRDRGFRFDESYVALEARVPEVAGWRGEVRLGALHVGEGVGGQRLQNAVHDVVGSDQVDLEYRGGDRWYPVIGLSGRRFLGHHSGAAWFARGELDGAPGFRSSLRVTVSGERPLRGDWSVRGELGVMGNYVETELLEEHVSAVGVAARLGVGYRRFLVEWNWNEYGTEKGHVSLGYRVGVGRATGGADE